MSGALRRVLTAKMLAVSALALAGIVMSVVSHRRELAADSSWHPGHEGYPPHVEAWLVSTAVGRVAGPARDQTSGILNRSPRRCRHG